MLSETFILSGIIALVVILSVGFILTRYRRSAPDELLVVYGKAGHVKGEDGKKILTPSKIIQGGGTFVWPIIQAWKKMSMSPIQIKETVDGIDEQKIKTHLPIVATVAISQDKLIQQNAATRFLSASVEDIRTQISEILIGESRGIMATMLIEDINADRNTFLNKVKESLSKELEKIGFDVVNINISEVKDDANYMANLGKKAATKAAAQAEADIADQEKQGKVKVANTKKEEAIATAEALRDKEIGVSKAEQEQEVGVAQNERDKEIRLAEADKERESGIAAQDAEKAANVANAKADAESQKAAAYARQVASVSQSENEAEVQKANFIAERTKKVATAEADAEATQNEQEAKKQVRIAQAEQNRQAETIKATQDKEAKQSEYESEKRQRAAEANRKAGVAEQEAKIDVANARADAGKAEADADKVTETAKVEAAMSVEKTRQQRQYEVNQAKAKAEEERLNATEIVPAQKMKEKVVIEGEQIRDRAILEAEGEKARIIKEAEGVAEATRMKLEAEAKGTRAKLLAEAEGAEAMAIAKAKGVQQEALAPAMAFERMVEAAGSPELAVQYAMTDKWESIFESQSHMLDHVQFGNMTIYGDSNTGANFARGLIQNFAPALDMLNSGLKGQATDLFGGIMGKGKKGEISAPKSEEKPAITDGTNTKNTDK